MEHRAAGKEKVRDGEAQSMEAAVRMRRRRDGYRTPKELESMTW